LPALAALAATWTYYLNLCTYIRENSFAFESFKNEITVCGAKPLYHRLQTYLSILNLKFKKLNCSLWCEAFAPMLHCAPLIVGKLRSLTVFCQFMIASASSRLV